MLVWDPVSETYLPFGHLKTHASDTAPKKRLSPRPCFVVFDLLYLNGKSLIDRSLIERKKNLRSIFKHVPGRLENVNEFPGNSVKDVQDRLRQVVEARYAELNTPDYLLSLVGQRRRTHYQTPTLSVHSKWARGSLDQNQAGVYGLLCRSLNGLVSDSSTGRHG